MRAERDPMSGKETEAAISEYEAIIAAGPGAAWLGLDVAYIGLAQLLATGPAEVRDPARAVELARKAVETNDDPNYRFTLATALEEAGENEAAIAEYEAIIAAGPGAAWPGYGLVYRRLARLLATGPAEVRNAARAVEFARKAVETNDDPNYRFALATALEEAGENEAAIAEYEAIIAAAPEAAGPGYGLVYHRLARLLTNGPAEVRNAARAVEFARKAVKTNDDPNYRFALATALEEAGENEAAIAEYEAIIAAVPEAAWPGYGLVYHRLARLLATGPAEVRDLARAVEFARKAVEANDDPDYRFTLAAVLEEAGEIEAAITELETVIAAGPGTVGPGTVGPGTVGPGYGLVYHRLARLLATGPAEVRDLARAVEFARKAVEANDDPDYRFTLAAVLEEAGEIEAAITELETVIAAGPGTVGPEYGLAYNGLAWLLATGPAEVRNAARAVELARKAVEANDDPDYRFTLATALEEAGETEVAIAEYEAIIAAAPEYGLAYNGLAWLLATGPAEIRNAARAVEFARKAVEANDDPDYRFTLATALEEAGETEAAIAEYEAIIAAAPEYGLAYNGLAWLLATGPAEVRNAARAVELARKTVEISDDPDYRDTLAAALAGAGETEAAIAEYEAIIAARPEYFVKWYHPALKQHGYGETVDGVYDEAALQALHACVRSGCQMVLADGE